ncbi:hypothetical protein GH714_022272 [Hevea brasiliensis]|uniref:Uncharacterized protein n=1 Tax=Hevea brasiliensis TaxID=3981 RepID=A0A6A6N2Y7_HEVBR|nr:hypothetical protein GH714_022272 [Hevea brasiliensis]
MLFIEMRDERGLPNLAPGHMSSSPPSFPSTPDASIGSTPGSYPSNRIMVRVVGGNKISDPGTGLSKHTGGSRSTVEHNLKMAKELQRDPNSWEVFEKLHKKRMKPLLMRGLRALISNNYIQDQMEAMVAAATIDATSNSQDDDS